eukprot:CAMPEP_0171593656 /NCGR_PEP_ID=MMETSP0990-20121206/244_1 /TAXON_ID=483369 /ORGANISM="non described non described, Strain CCMP2098" /LENGTH=104 /DNA_ID=CAMNT_0012154237 /DNA_START=195 /DNA_END=510 /DNA_ORIENTATION=-
MSLLLYFCPTLGEVAVGEHKGGNDGPKVEETADPRRRDIHPHGGVARGGARRRRPSPRVAPVREHAAPVARDEAHHRVELPRRDAKGGSGDSDRGGGGDGGGRK